MQLNRFSVVCGCVLQRGQMGLAWCGWVRRWVGWGEWGWEDWEGWTGEIVWGIEWVCVKRFLVLVLVLDWTQCLPQGAGAPPAMMRGRMTGFLKKLGARASGEAGYGGYYFHSPSWLWYTNHAQAVSVWCLCYSSSYFHYFICIVFISCCLLF